MLLADSKTCTKLSKGLEANAAKDSFNVAAKRLGLVPKLVASPTSTSESTTNPDPPVEDEEWQTDPNKDSPKAKPKASAGPPKSPPKPRTFALAPEGWSIPVLPCTDIRPDTSGICAVDDEKLAHETWARCKSSGKTIAFVGPRDVKVGTTPLKMLLVPFIQKVEGLLDRKKTFQFGFINLLSTMLLSPILGKLLTCVILPGRLRYSELTLTLRSSPPLIGMTS